MLNSKSTNNEIALAQSEPLPVQITEVWASNLEQEFLKIRELVEQFPYVAVDTEFPGIVVKPMYSAQEYNYQTVKCNVDLLNVIQLGITFANSAGRRPSGTSTWQFNFKFNMQSDMYAIDSINFLKECGIDFDAHQKNGINAVDFGELIMSSGLVMNDDVKWISFHGSYDFGYLLKLLTCQPLPHSQTQFFESLRTFFPSLYDIKFLLRNIERLPLLGGISLQSISDHLQVSRIGAEHQAGSDSYVTSGSFFRLMDWYFDNEVDDAKFSGIIYGLGSDARIVYQPNSIMTSQNATAAA